MTDKHTPGPWVAEDHGEVQSHRGRMVTIRDHRNIHVATVDGLDASVRGQELANARLIAAAPEMLKALEACEPVLRKDGERTLVVRNAGLPGPPPEKGLPRNLALANNARAAIKAAKGDA